MHWKHKAKLQNAVSLLPSSASYTAYYWMQRHFGIWKHINPIDRLTSGIEIWQRIQDQGYHPEGGVFLEVGTGSVPLVPLAFWLMGAERVITIDLNPYLKEELVRESLQFIAHHPDEIESLFGNLIQRERLDALLSLDRQAFFSLQDFLDLCRIEYIAPRNAAETRLPPQSIDFHTSFAVFEHIPPAVLHQILAEGLRIIRDTGLFVHRIDYSDHFSHTDQQISAINFLQYSDDEWNQYAGNRYMYTNRLRHDDVINLFNASGHQIVNVQALSDPHARALLQSGSFALADRFQSKSEEILTTTGAWIVSHPPVVGNHGLAAQSPLKTD